MLSQTQGWQLSPPTRELFPTAVLVCFGEHRDSRDGWRDSTGTGVVALGVTAQHRRCHQVSAGLVPPCPHPDLSQHSQPVPSLGKLHTEPPGFSCPQGDGNVTFGPELDPGAERDVPVAAVAQLGMCRETRMGAVLGAGRGSRSRPGPIPTLSGSWGQEVTLGDRASPGMHKHPA